MNKTEKQNAAIKRVLADDPVTTIIEAITETSVLADTLFDALKNPVTLDSIVMSALSKGYCLAEGAIRSTNFSFSIVLIEAVRQYALEVAKTKGYYDEDWE